VERLVNLLNFIIIVEYFQMSESVFPENAIVRRQFIQLFTRAAGNGVSAQNSIRAIKRIGNVLINLKLGFFRLPVVVRKQIVLKILIAFL